MRIGAFLEQFWRLTSFVPKLPDFELLDSELLDTLVGQSCGLVRHSRAKLLRTLFWDTFVGDTLVDTFVGLPCNILMGHSEIRSCVPFL